jgi:DNA-binding NarL/FixJ family response regulator
VLSVNDDEPSVVNAIEAGAMGFVLKQSSPGDLLDALRTVAKGGSYLGSQVSSMVFRRFQQKKPSSTGNDKVDSLSPRERQVLRLVAEGKSSKEIANALGLELETVRSYRKTMMKKLGINNAATLTRFAVSSGLTPVESV